MSYIYYELIHEYLSFLHVNKQIITTLTAIKIVVSVITIYTQQCLHLISLKSSKQNVLQRSSNMIF